MNNPQIAAAFDEIADILEFQGANAFRVRAYRNGARILRDLSDSVAAMVEDADRDLTDIDGIGKDLAGKIALLVETGELEMLSELREQVPATVLAMMRIDGLGPKKAAVLHKELGIQNLDQLRAACVEEKVRQLKGFGAKTEETILKGIDLAATANDRMLWFKADEIVQEILAHLKTCDAVGKLEAAGSYRRGRETVGDLDFLVTSDDPSTVMDCLADYPNLADTIARGDTKMSIRTGQGLQVDLRVVPEESFGAALQYFTGSKDHNVVLRGMAKKQGLKINEWGVYRVVEGKEDERIAGATEAEVYGLFDLPVFAPELREARHEYDWAENGDLPELVTADDIRGDLHMHTNASDGKATLEEMVAAAQARGLNYIAITDHSKRLAMARGLDEQRLLAQWEEVDALNDKLGDEFTLLKGIECDILEQGGMDLTDEVLAQADWVIGSVHMGQKQTQQQITDRIVGALENPHVDIIAHPTGRKINSRAPYAVDLATVYAAAKENGKMLELNANPLRLDLNEIHCAAAKAHGIPIVISTDAHNTAHFDFLRCGILQARRAGLTKDDVANTRTWPQFQKLLK